MTILIELSTIFFGTFFTIFLPYLVAYFTALTSVKNSSHASDRFWRECHHKMHLFFMKRHLTFNKNKSHVRVSVRHQDEQFQDSDGQDVRLARYLYIHSKALKRKSVMFNEFKIIVFGIFVSIVLSFAASLIYLATGQSVIRINLIGMAPLAISGILSTLVFQNFQRSLSEAKIKVEDIIEESKNVSKTLEFRSE